MYTVTEKARGAPRVRHARPLHAGQERRPPRLLIADLVGEAPTRASLDALREDVADLLARIEENEESARALPHRAKYLLMVNDFLRGFSTSTCSWWTGRTPSSPRARRGRSGGGQVGALEVGDQGVRAQLAPGRLAHEVGRLHAGAVAVHALPHEGQDVRQPALLDRPLDAAQLGLGTSASWAAYRFPRV